MAVPLWLPQLAGSGTGGPVAHPAKRRHLQAASVCPVRCVTRGTCRLPYTFPFLFLSHLRFYFILSFRCINYLFTDKAYRFISAWPPHGAATAACGFGVLASDTTSPEAVRPSAPKSSSVAPALHRVCCESPPAATWLCFPSFTSFVCSKTSVGSWGGVDSTHGRRVPPQPQHACLPQRHTSVRAPHALNRSDGKGYSPPPISDGVEYLHNVPELLLSRDKAAAPAAA